MQKIKRDEVKVSSKLRLSKRQSQSKKDRERE